MSVLSSHKPAVTSTTPYIICLTQQSYHPIQSTLLFTRAMVNLGAQPLQPLVRVGDEAVEAGGDVSDDSGHLHPPALGSQNI